MSVVTGIDAQHVGEVKGSLAQFGRRYSKQLFTQAEIRCAEERGHDAASWLAGCFAAKEAVLKILEANDLGGAWTSIEVRQDKSGRHGIALSGAVADVARGQGLGSLCLSVAVAGDVATAVVMAEVATHLGSGS